jgi:hypothetical protein
VIALAAKYSEIMADNLRKAGWSWGCVLTLDCLLFLMSKSPALLWIEQEPHRVYLDQMSKTNRAYWQINAHSGALAEPLFVGKE